MQKSKPQITGIFIRKLDSWIRNVIQTIFKQYIILTSAYAFANFVMEQC